MPVYADRVQGESAESGENSTQFEPLEQLAYIRETIEHSATFTAVSGWGLVAVGTTALCAALLASRLELGTTRWLSFWIVEAIVAAALALASICFKARRNGLPLFSGPGRKVALGLMPALVAGALMTAVLYRTGLAGQVPAMWMLLYGAGVIAGGVWSVAPVPLMGSCFMLAGGILAFSPGVSAEFAMASTFGFLHIIFGWIITRRYGG